MKNYEFIKYNEEEGIATISLNRPDVMNALSYPLLMEIIDVLESKKKDKSIHVLVIQGSELAFSSGDDLKSMGPEGVRFQPLEDGSRMPHHRVIRLIREIRKPVIALIQGYCIGAGFELSLACDFRLAASNLKIGDYRASKAICVMSGASWFLPRIIGFSRATEMILTGRLLDAQEALEIGLVNKVYPVSNFKAKTMDYIRKMADMPTICLGYNKSMLNFSQYNELFPSLQYEFKLYLKNIRTQDFGEGMKSFIKKREPKFKGK
ncbi:MAG: enoyl-CoA hydratase/isomerase family protein [Candidatus Heimdallarchaeota archaeon]